jgi:glutathione peroxidase
MSLYDIEIRPITGETRRVGDYAGKTMLVVNVASGCGLTPQYAGLEALYRRYQDRGLVVLGFPCNQFARQEPGDEAAIQQFCSATYDVSFPLFRKIDVNGANAHPLFVALKKAAPGILGTEAIKWNFTKFLVDASGTVVTRFGPRDEPASLMPAIDKVLPPAVA